LLVLASPWFGRRLLVWVPLALVAWVTDVYAAIVFGVVAAMLLQRYPGFHLRGVARAALVAVIVFSWFANLHTAHYRLIAPWCGIALVLLLAVQGERRRLGEIAGGLSYPLYLNHWIGGFAATVLLAPFGLGHSFAQLCIGAVLSIALAAALYWFIDRRLLDSRDRLYSRRRARVTLGVGYGMVPMGLLFAASVAR
ncbi:MAG: hypothetical protein ABIV63_01890, partial [Caldimonas sp.]